MLKGDIDNLGELFRVGLGNPTFAKTAALSRQVNGFFAIYLPWLLSREFASIYTVFAGGDDFFLIGPWRTVQKLAARMRDDFADYVAQNPEIHFSAGIVAEKPGAPVGALADLAEAALDRAKDFRGEAATTPVRPSDARRRSPQLFRSRTPSPALAKPSLGASGQSWNRRCLRSMP